MIKNIGSADKILRVIIALALSALYITGVVEGAFGIGLLVFGGILILTSVVGTCGLYIPFGINTCKLKDTESK